MDEPLVLLPGMNCTEALWCPVADRLRVQRPGLTIRHARLAEDSVDGCVADLLGSLPERFALAGLSLGGIIAMALVRTAPERVSRLLLTSTNSRPPTTAQRESWARQRAELAQGRTAKDLQRELLPVLLHAPNRTPGLDELVLTMGEETGADVLSRQLATQATRIDERPGLQRIGVPTLVLAAAADALCPVDRHEEMAHLVPHSRMEVLENVGHLATLEAPDDVAAAVTRWLDLEPERSWESR
ncbi:alpha/beta fold hydrolase [Kribbella shirazensis]|uniref:Pimeloyl-ACP methyl ester carboxylesterase n=1 Tax=Kribbella shirazensis TaxID=1105143 RepID=A0A7X5VJK2_9ACTN|nr:alpha/beta hydrolase [Kribbella shirazensis]NIK61582.1 pimeloyl-ACP methyl ester carboxylesterase [Kribbella shirazensis]